MVFNKNKERVSVVGHIQRKHVTLMKSLWHIWWVGYKFKISRLLVHGDVHLTFLLWFTFLFQRSSVEWACCTSVTLCFTVTLLDPFTAVTYCINKVCSTLSRCCAAAQGEVSSKAPTISAFWLFYLVHPSILLTYIY